IGSDIRRCATHGAYAHAASRRTARGPSRPPRRRSAARRASESSARPTVADRGPARSPETRGRGGVPRSELSQGVQAFTEHLLVLRQRGHPRTLSDSPTLELFGCSASDRSTNEDHRLPDTSTGSPRARLSDWLSGIA